MRKNVSLCVLTMLVLTGFAMFAAADSPPADNTLTAAEKAEGWQLLFNGKDYTGWKNNSGKPIACGVVDGAMEICKAGGYVVVYDKQFGDFIFECDVKQVKPDSNSGVFFRMAKLGDPVNSGFECQVYKGGTDMHDMGAIYDLVPAKVNAVKEGEWNHLRIKCVGPHISTEVNGQPVASMNTDEWPVYGKRPDGTKHKFKTAIKDMARVGYIGFQDHGDKNWFKNVKLLELNPDGTPKK
ncbi:MAG: DUF1080 domain-containing protein [Phycisphaera sp.]|nr:DUF1080 domain-containing protein [Phycisphaera sp.]